MSDRNDLGLGKIITSVQFRDAIHIAVAPVIANEFLKPGEHIGIVKVENDKYYVGKTPTKIGIVDPYLGENVPKGKWFWLFLYPNTVTSLRHEWTHPSFKGDARNEKVKESIEWLTRFANRVLDISYAELIDALDKYVQHGQQYCLSFDTPDECWSQKREMWSHYEIVTGKTLSEDDRDDGYVFRCAC